ncbi:gas vesicle protein GVPa [Haloterrigena turkmenica DSM 5511]|uniref:Gas vesicle protein GVPa n=1 Tax=Haloterrigena turkmenica (strain ATCC 51198 / DSM 5511 / JCM 9101 / NCIMB 13204 / VKM B-1734 / 4k) TaxID=543526 RepID=D2RV43_HALTV|nr:gas vesicle protein [Haloterrigena turkmenica]ADB61244.1 gas vesicle protein GVPa [Haloterrigena turkmenica DSM 5511]
MRPRKDEETLVDVLDVLLMEGAVLRADVIVSVAGIPLIGVKLTAAIAGMETMNEYGLFEEWDVERRQTSITRRQHKKKRNRKRAPNELERLTVGSTPEGERSRDRDRGDESSRDRAEERSRGDDGEQSRTENDERSDGDAPE